MVNYGMNEEVVEAVEVEEVEDELLLLLLADTPVQLFRSSARSFEAPPTPFTIRSVGRTGGEDSRAAGNSRRSFTVQSPSDIKKSHDL